MTLLKETRSKELDFLRGMAVIIVLFRHYYFSDFTRTMGWIGVDLFFVLSGFLISGLLFKEYSLHGNIHPGLFLIRRGFKIYPLFYIAICLTLVISFFLKEKVSLIGLFGELFFLQNYIGGLWNHTWSLAVEEHFYILAAIILSIIVKRHLLEKYKLVFFSFLFLMIAGLLIRFVTNYWLFPEHNNVFNTHLRFDSLLAGVFISYLFHFRRKILQDFFIQYRTYIFILPFLLLSFTPLVPFKSFFVKTIGFSLVYVAFGLLLVFFIMEPKMEIKLKSIFGGTILTIICKVGYYSYSIYLFHMFVAKYIMNYVTEIIDLPFQVDFIIYFLICILLGILVSKLIEMPILKLRDKYFPARSIRHVTEPLMNRIN